MAPGYYSLKCSFDESKKKQGFTKFRIHCYDPPAISEVSPNETEVNTETNVTVRGRGFFNSPTLVCVITTEKNDRGEVKKLRFPAIYVSQTTVICILKRFSRAQHGKITVLLAPGAENEKLANAIAVKFSFYDRVSNPLKCEFSASARFISIHFDKPVDCSNKWESCDRFINGSALSKLTKASRSRCKNGKFIIDLQNSKLRLGDKMELVLRNFKSRWSRYTKHFPSEKKTLTCNFEDGVKPLEFKVEISGPKIVGMYKGFLPEPLTVMGSRIDGIYPRIHSDSVKMSAL